MGLFDRSKKDPTKKKTIELKKELRKLVKKKKYPEALKIGNKILEKTPHDNDVLFILGGIYYMQNKLKTAISFFDKALDIAEYDTQVLLLKANAHYKLGETTKSKFCCEKILEVDPKNKVIKELKEKLSN